MLLQLTVRLRLAAFTKVKKAIDALIPEQLSKKLAGLATEFNFANELETGKEEREAARALFARLWRGARRLQAQKGLRAQGLPTWIRGSLSR